MDERLKAIYYDPSHPAGYAGAFVLAKAAGTDLKTVQKWLQGHSTYTLHKPARKRYGSRRYRMSGMDHQWQADLVDMQAYAKENDGYNHILTVIDMFSRYAWAEPIKSKVATNVQQAFERIFQDRKPFKIQTDQGMEFESRAMKEWWARHGIEQFSVKSQFKAAMVERFNRTLKTKMWRVFTNRGKRRWLEILPQLVLAYNASVHRMIGKRPIDITKDNETETWVAQENVTRMKRLPKPRVQVGDHVRLSKVKWTFDKGYLPNWTEEIFVVTRVLPTTPPQIKVKDYNGEEIEGSFYLPEIQKVDKPDEYKIEKVIRTKKVKGKTQYLVKWLGYLASFNSWVDEIRDIV